MALSTLYRDRVARPLFDWAKRALPSLSDTERDALHAGEVWWDAELFTGNPDWSVLLDVAEPRLTPQEKAFLDGPCSRFCAMIDDWAINHEIGDLPPQAWAFLKRERFFGMIIPQRYGGLEFSAYAHSEIVRRISSRSVAAAVTVMVPNSLGPGELLLQFGTDAQREYWLPRLADGREIPAFALTSEEAGSDASAMRDSGVVCRGQYLGKDVIGMRLNWKKRYITLGPVATVLGLAVKLVDPDHLLGDEVDIGITSVLVPTNLPGVQIGRRHIPSGQMFQNGPNAGTDVFIPLENIIGGPDCAGKGWMMLMSALAAGRGISLPSLAAAATALCAHATGAYARIRRQFGIPVGRFEGVQKRLSRVAVHAYVLDGARRLTCAGLDQGRRLAVISAIMKAHATYRMREAVDAAMDVHAGKAVIDGPLNLVGNVHRAVPVGITVEGANIVTRNLIIFGQGAIRCHPFLLDEMLALQHAPGAEAEAAARERFDRLSRAHAKHVLKTVLRAFARAWTGGRFAPAPPAGLATPIFRQMSRHAAAFALVSEAALISLGGSLKRREMLSARLGDVLSELYLLSGACKRWLDEGRHDADFPLLEHAARDAFATIGRAHDEVLANLPNRPLAWALRCLVLPSRSRGADDALARRCAELLLVPSATRARLIAGLHHGEPGDPMRDLDEAWTLVCEADGLHRKLHDAGGDPERARRERRMSDAELDRLARAEAAVARVVAVDDFDPDEVLRAAAGATAHRRQQWREARPAGAGDEDAHGPDRQSHEAVA
ncbi:MAG: acyl-CoA dehydrogenase [Lautropia sp.]